MRVYVGTYTGRESRGIYRLDFDPATGQLSPASLAAESESPSFLALHPDGRHLYSVSEISAFNGERVGAVSAYAIDPASGALTYLNQQSSRGAGPCHLLVDAAGRHVLVANYGGGSVAVLPIETGDGRLGAATAFVQHQGSGPNPQRQEGPHAHAILLDRDNQFAVAADLGLDRLFVYRFDAASGTLTAHDPPAAAVAPGAGPRHFAFHPSLPYAYVNNELDSTITAFAYDAQRGTLTALQTLTTLPEGFTGGNSTAEIAVHPSGKFAYVSNRGHNSIAVFGIDPQTGRLAARGQQATGGKTPRSFGIDPSGAFLLAANQDSDTLVPFRVDPERGTLDRAGPEVHVPAPVCVVFLPAGH